MPQKLSSSQEKLLAQMGDSTLIRWPGGYWTTPDTKSDPLSQNLITGPVPEWYFSTNTVRALIDKGILIVTKRETFHKNRTEVPVEVKKAEKDNL